MSNRFLSSGDETKYHLLAGFETRDEGGSSGSRTAFTFGAAALLEKLGANIAAIIAAALSTSASDIAPRDPNAPELQER